MDPLYLLILIALVSGTVSAWSFSKAFRVHGLIESTYPGLNERMRQTCSLLKRRGFKK